MIIRRYLNLQVLGTTLAVSSLLTIILLSSRVIQFFEKAANGKIAVDLLAAVIWYRLPGFLELILPLALFMGLLLALGRLYLDNEMAILFAAGVGITQVLRWLLPSTILLTLLTGMFSTWLTPVGLAEADRLYAEQANRSTFDLIQTGRFQRIGSRMLYADTSPDKSKLRDILILEAKPARGDREARQIIISALEARRINDPVLGRQTVELHTGERWDLRAGSADYQRMQFDSYRMRLKQEETPDTSDSNYRGQSTWHLRELYDNNSKAAAEWGWRWSLIMMVPILSLLAMPLAKVNPRQGRYLKLLPALVLYLSYIILIVAIKNAVEKKELLSYAFWGIHALYLSLALVLTYWQPKRRGVAT